MSEPDPTTSQLTQDEAAVRDRLLFRWADLPLVTSEVPGTGGTVRSAPEDFRVTELPAYLPEGSGSHRYLLVEKRGYTTRELVQALMRGGVEEKAIGVAGLKDKAAVTVQWQDDRTEARGWLVINSLHGGAAGSVLWCDPEANLIVAFIANRCGVGNDDAFRTIGEFYADC